MKLFSTFLKDLKLSFRSFYIYIEIIMAVIFIAVLLFVVPENFTAEGKVFVYLDSEARIGQLEQLESLPAGVSFVDSDTALRKSLEENRDATGLIVSAENNRLHFEFVLQGYESEQIRNILQKQFVAPMLSAMPEYKENIVVTNLTASAEKLPDRINILPVLLILNSAFVGLFTIAAYLFMDKEEGTIKAIAVTPARVWQYLLSKVGVMLVTGIATGSLVVLSIAWNHVNYGHFLVLMFCFNLFGSALGLFIASFYDTLTKALGSLYILILILSLTSVSYFMPSFSPRLITWLPSYPMLFAMRETLLQKPDIQYIYSWALIFAAISTVLFLLADRRYKRTITI
jgi:ABC-type multidrug transport system permease subunit